MKQFDGRLYTQAEVDKIIFYFGLDKDAVYNVLKDYSADINDIPLPDSVNGD